jgi:hypothetical protein
MSQITRTIGKWMTAVLRRQPIMQFGRGRDVDWLPPVLGPGDWSSGLFASMADKDLPGTSIVEANQALLKHCGRTSRLKAPPCTSL